mgnify:CR=1 FL=1
MAKTEKSFRQMQEELDQILMKMQSADGDIDESIKSYEDGLKLIQQMEEYLSQAENKIKKIKAKFDV